MKLQVILALFAALLASACCNNRRGHCGRVYQGRMVENCNRASVPQTRCDSYHIHISGGDYTQSDFAEVAEAEKRRGGTPEEVRQRILQQLPGASVEVTLKGTSYRGGSGGGAFAPRPQYRAPFEGMNHPPGAGGVYADYRMAPRGGRASFSQSGNLVLEGDLGDYERNAGPLYHAAPRRPPQPFNR